MGAIAQTVESIVGAAQVTRLDEVAAPLQKAIRGAIAIETLPTCVVSPQTPEHLAEVMACADQNQWRLLPCGHGSKLGWGALLTGADLVVSTQHLSQVIEHAEGDLTVTAQAGVSFARLQADLLKTRQFLAIDPAYADRATLGGIVATRDTGAWRQRFGGIRDMLIGVSLVRPDGQMVKAGGRVVKNVAGYDLMKLMTGSFGTLGVLTQLTFRTYPLQEASETVLLTGRAAAIQPAIAAILQSALTPVQMDVLSTGLMPQTDTDAIGLALQFQSIAAGVAEQVERLQAIAATHDLAVQTFQESAETQFWQTLQGRLWDHQGAERAIAKLGVLPAQAIEVLTALAPLLAPDTWQMRLHANSGIGILRLGVAHNSVRQLKALRSRCQAAGGYLNLLEAPLEWKQRLDPWGLAPATQQLMGRLRANFDPQGRLSPGRLE